MPFKVPQVMKAEEGEGALRQVEEECSQATMFTRLLPGPDSRWVGRCRVTPRRWLGYMESPSAMDRLALLWESYKLNHPSPLHLLQPYSDA